jgi:hypothetical protein
LCKSFSIQTNKQQDLTKLHRDKDNRLLTLIKNYECQEDLVIDLWKDNGSEEFFDDYLELENEYIESTTQ